MAPASTRALRPAGHGLDAAGGRLAMLFGDRAAMRVESRPGYSGVTIELPDEQLRT